MSYPLEQLWRSIFRGPPMVLANSSTNQFAGRTALGSAETTVTVSTQVVNSDSIVMLSLESYTSQTSGGPARHVEVKSISPGNFFTIGTSDGGGWSYRATTIHWVIFKAS